MDHEQPTGGHDALLVGGGIVHIRPFEPGRDAVALRGLYAGLSDQSVYLRWFSAGRASLERDIDRMTSTTGCQETPPQRRARVAERHGELVGISGWELLPDRATAEVAFVIDERLHGRGLASLLLEELAADARSVGISTFVADVLAGNPHMVHVFRDAGFVVVSATRMGVINLSFATGTTDATEAVSRQRESDAEQSSLTPLFLPRNIAVVCCDERDRDQASQLVRQLGHGRERGVQLYEARTDRAVEPADLVVYPSTRASTVDQIVTEVTRREAHALLILDMSGQLDETARGVLLSRCRDRDIRLVGPCSIGLFHQSPGSRVNAVPGFDPPGAGRVGLLMQAGSPSRLTGQRSAIRDLGPTSFLSLGIGNDVAGSEMLEWWEADDNTLACGVQVERLEVLGNLGAFARTATRLGARKPTVMFVTQPADVAGLASYLAGSGVIGVTSARQLRETLALAGSAPLPRGDRVGIVSDDDAAAGDAAAAVRAQGMRVGRVLVVPHLEVETVASVWRGHDCDAVIIAGTPDVTLEAAWSALEPAARLPTLVTTADAGRAAGQIPRFRSPAEACRALGRLNRHAAWRRDQLTLGDLLDDITLQALHLEVDGFIRSHPLGGWLEPVSGRILLPGGPAELHVVVDPIYGLTSLGVEREGRPLHATLIRLATRIQDIAEVLVVDGRLTLRLAPAAGDVDRRMLR